MTLPRRRPRHPPPPTPASPQRLGTYTNPLSLETSTGPAVSCPDPAIIKQPLGGVDTWYLYCTGDPLNSSDVNSQGQLNSHLILQFKSTDLIHWTYIGDAFPQTPAWIGNA